MIFEIWQIEYVEEYIKLFQRFDKPNNFKEQYDFKSKERKDW